MHSPDPSPPSFLEASNERQQFVNSWLHLMGAWDPQIVSHSQRVAKTAVHLAQRRGWRNPELQALEWGALLHDLGKMCIPPAILLAQTPLTEQDWAVIKRHPIFGYEAIHEVAGMELAGGIILCHHENWDGSGYPRGLKAEQIPPGARIVAIAEVWDALTSNPSDRAMWPRERVLSYMRDQAGRKFEPEIVDTFAGIASVL